MGQREKPEERDAHTQNSDALAKIARLISVSDDDAERHAARDSDDADETPGETARDNALSLASLRVPGAGQLLEALPAGLAVCNRAGLIRANSAFALAFGYPSEDKLREAGGLNAVFPAGAKSIAKRLAGDGAGQSGPLELDARSRSGRAFRVPVAVHPLESETEEHAALIVLHPETGGITEPPPPAGGAAEADETGKPEKDPGGAAKAKPAKKRPKKRKKPPKDAKDSGAPGVFEGLNKTEFLAKVSHELRTPLNSILGFAELMKDEQLGPIGNERYRGYIRDIHESGLYALSLVNDLLDISKIEAGEFELNFTAVELDEVVAESVHSMEPQAQRQRVLLRTSFAEDLPPVLADRRSIRQIILNLVSNGIKFTRPGGQVIVSTQRTAAGGARIRVRDTGVGMSKSEITLALQPFQQLDTSPRQQAGTGLGLPLTKALAEANRAKFKLRSIAEQGTRIDITFPPERTAPAKD